MKQAVNITTIRNWYEKAQTHTMYRFHGQDELFNDLQLKIQKRTGAVIVSLVEIAETHRGQGFWTSLVHAMTKEFTVIVECPQPRLHKWCSDHGIAVID